MGRAETVSDINKSLLRGNIVVEKTAQLELQEWGAEFGTSCSDSKTHMTQRK